MDYYFLAGTILFQGISPDNIPQLLECLGTEQRKFKKGSILFHTGDTIQSMGLVLSGSVTIENDDLWGNKSILDHIGTGEIFAETYACIPEEPLMVNVTAAETAEVLFFHTDRLLKTCQSSCEHHSQLIRNLLTVTAQKNLNLSRHILHTSSKYIRGRLLSYLSFQAGQQGTLQFTIPFNRQQLADYLNVDRSSLSKELSKMQKEGLLSVQKNQFFLKEEKA